MAVAAGVQRDGAEFTAQVGDGDDVDAGNGQEQGVRRTDGEVGERAFQLENLLVFMQAIVVEGGEDAAEFEGVRAGGRCLLGPGEDLVKGLAAAAQAGVRGDVLQARQTGREDGLRPTSCDGQ